MSAVTAAVDLDEYQDAVSSVTALLGHGGNSPEDLMDAVGQIDRLLHGLDLDGELKGHAEVIRILVTYAHLGAWFMQGMTGQPIAGEKAPARLLALLNSRPDVERVVRLLRGATDTAETTALVSGFLDLFNRERASVPQ